MNIKPEEIPVTERAKDMSAAYRRKRYREKCVRIVLDKGDCSGDCKQCMPELQKLLKENSRRCLPGKEKLMEVRKLFLIYGGGDDELEELLFEILL